MIEHSDLLSNVWTRLNVQEYLELIKSLNDRGVQFVVIGGFAMILHGTSSVTFDLDLAIALDSANSNATVEALRSFRPYPPKLGSAKNFVWDERSFTLDVVTLETTVGKIDLLRLVPGIDSFEGLWTRAERRSVGGMDIRIASIEDLLSMKQVAGRPKDIEHIRQLQALKELRAES